MRGGLASYLEVRRRAPELFGCMPSCSGAASGGGHSGRNFRCEVAKFSVNCPEISVGVPNTPTPNHEPAGDRSLPGIEARELLGSSFGKLLGRRSGKLFGRGSGK